MAAVKPATYNADGSIRTYGHVAVVEEVFSDGRIRVSEYNSAETGAYTSPSWVGKPADRGFTKFVDFGIKGASAFTGVWYLRNYNSSGVSGISFTYGNAGDIPVVGDWNGDGKDTPGVVRNGVWYLRNSNTSGVSDISFTYGNPGWSPVVGDWNADGKDTPGVVNNATWYLRNSNTSGVSDISFTYGNPGWIPLAGDWDGYISDTPGVGA